LIISSIFCFHPFASQYYPTGKTKYVRKSVMKKYINGKEANTIEEREPKLNGKK
jgi:hypothetical protein